MLTKQKLEKFAATVFWFKEIKCLNDIQVTFYLFLPWIFFINIRAKRGGGDHPPPPSPLATQLHPRKHDKETNNSNQ